MYFYNLIERYLTARQEYKDKVKKDPSLALSIDELNARHEEQLRSSHGGVLYVPVQYC